MEPAELVALPLFSALCDEDRAFISRYAERTAVPAGKMIALEGETGYEFFVIEDGTARVYQDDRHLRDLGPGDFFGEIALLTTGHRTASVVARTPMRLVVVTRRGFAHLLAGMPDVAHRIRAALHERLEAAPPRD